MSQEVQISCGFRFWWPEIYSTWWNTDLWSQEFKQSSRVANTICNNNGMASSTPCWQCLMFIYSSLIWAICIIPVDQYCSEGLKISKRFSTPPTPPPTQKRRTKNKTPRDLPQHCEGSHRSGSEKKKHWKFGCEPKKQMVPCAAKSKLSSWGTCFFFMGFLLQGPTKKRLKYCFWQLWVAVSFGGFISIEVWSTKMERHCIAMVDVPWISKGWVEGPGRGSQANKMEQWHMSKSQPFYIHNTFLTFF